MFKAVQGTKHLALNKRLVLLLLLLLWSLLLRNVVRAGSSWGLADPLPTPLGAGGEQSLLVPRLRAAWEGAWRTCGDTCRT